MDTYFYHSGSFGDMIYSLPTVKQMGGGIFVSDLPLHHTRNITELLEFQPYITEVLHRTQTSLPPSFINLSKFHQQPGLYKNHLVDSHAEAQGISLGCWEATPWLSVPSPYPFANVSQLGPKLRRDAYAVVNVTPRYRDKFFNWSREINYLFRQVEAVYFVGYRQEYETSGLDEYRGGLYGQHRVEFVETDNMMQAAAIIKEAALFSGNQSSMLAIRQGLGLPYRFEQAPHHPNTEQRSGLETILNPISRRAHLAYISLKKIFV